jgi:hypothetical protein
LGFSKGFIMGDRFQHLVDKYADQVKAADVGPSTEVVLVFQWADKDENVLHIARENMGPSVKVEGMGSGDAAKRFATSKEAGGVRKQVGSDRVIS